MNTIWFPDLSRATGPKYKTLISALRDAVAQHVLEPGEKLPPVRDVAWRMGITPGTVARAYSWLVDEGVLEAVVGRGTFVREPATLQPRQEDPLINTVVAGKADFRGCRVPDVGQGNIINDALRTVAQNNDDRFVDYPTAVTDLAARQAVVQWIGPDHVGRFDQDDVVLGLGAQNATLLAMQTILRGAHPVIMTERLTYPGVRRAAGLLRAELVGLEMDEQGIRPDSVEEMARLHGPQVLITSAEVHSPTAIRTTFERKKQIAALAERYNFQIIEDDCHRIAPAHCPSYRAIAPSRAWYVGSLTKCVAASLRFGFIVAPTGMGAMASQVAQSSFYGLPQPILDTCTLLIRSGAAGEIRDKVVANTAHRIRDAVNYLGQWDIRYRQDVPFIWLRMPNGWRGSLFAMAAERMDIRLKAADEFSLVDGSAPAAVRLAINATMTTETRNRALANLSCLLSKPPRDAEI